MNRITRFLRGLLGAKPKKVAAAYDAAQSGPNDDHWSWADSLNANAANSPEIRRTLRERARYEVANNGYAGGLVEKLANDLVKTGPRLQLRIPGVGREVARQIETAFVDWARRSKLWSKIRLLDNMAVRDGEGFALLTTNPALDPHGVQLDLRLYETDQIDTPFPDWTDPLAFPGGRLDEHGNVTEWHFMKVHPGSNVWMANWLDHDAIPASEVIHWFKPRRAGQVRGIPEITSSLTLYAYLRRYTLATLGSAELAAKLAGMLKTNLPADANNPNPTFSTYQDVDIPNGALLTLPQDWEATQFKPEQPITTYKDFKGEILTEAGQAVGAPRNIATGSSAEYNYSSGRLDHGIYHDGVKVRRDDLRTVALDKILRVWLDEAFLRGIIPDGLPLRSAWSWEWFYPGFLSLDPQKDAAADAVRLGNGTTTYAEILAERGLDWEEVFEQRKAEADRMAELGLRTVKARRRRGRKAVAA